MSDINQISDAETIANRVFMVREPSDLEKELIKQILDEWNEEWISFTAELKLKINESDNSDQIRRSNAERLAKRMKQMRSIRPVGIPAMLREDTV